MRLPSRVLMTVDTIGGVWTYALTLAREMEPYGIEIILATLGTPPTPLQRRQAMRLKNVQMEESEFRLEWMDNPWRDVDQSVEWLQEIVEKHAPDLLHFNGYSHAAVTWRQPVIVTAHSCVQTWWQAVHQVPAPPDYDEYKRRVAEGLHRAQTIIVPSAALLRQMVTIYGPLPRAQLIHNGLPQQRHGMADKHQFILSAGRLWDAAKNIEVLEPAAVRLPWPILVAGETTSPDGDMRPLRHLKTMGLLSPEDLQSYMQAASIYAAPALYEPFGLAVLEAARVGCALVLSDIDTFRELWDGAAIFADPRDPDSWFSAFDRLAKSATLRASFSARALERAQVYNQRRMVARHVETYAMAISQRHHQDAPELLTYS